MPPARRASDTSLTVRVALLEEQLVTHIALCDRRAALAQKLLFTLAGMGAVTIGFLIRLVFHLPIGG